MATRLTSKHPHAKAADQVWALMAKLKVRIQLHGHRTVITVDGCEYELEDVEDSTAVSDFPPMYEAKLVRGRE